MRPSLGHVLFSVAALLLPACSDIAYQSVLAKPATAGRPYMAGVGDTVLDLKQTQSLPNVLGKADVFGRTRDAGRVTVRFVGMDGDRAVFVRQDTLIQSNETTETQGPRPVPTYRSTTVAGSIGTVPVSANSGAIGVDWVPATPAYSYPLQQGQIQLTAPIGGSVMVEGRRLNVLRSLEGGLEYSVD